MPSLKASLAALPRPAWILFAGTFINRFGSFVVIFITLYMTRQGFSLSQAGLGLAAYGAGNLVSSALGGYLADRIGRRRTIVLSMFSAAATIILLAAARELYAIVLLAALTGLTADLYRAPASALLADLIPAGQRLTAFTMYRLSINAGIAVGAAAGGVLAERSFFFLFLVDAVTSVLYGFIAMFALPEGHRAPRHEARWSAALSAIGRDSRFVLFLVSTFLITFVFFQFESTFALHVLDGGYSAATYGLLISLNGLLIILGELALTLITQKYAPIRVIALGYLLVGIGFALNVAAPRPTVLILSVVIWTLGEMVSAPVSATYVADLAPEHLRGRYMGVFGLTWAAGLMLGPALGAVLYASNPRLLWIACGFLGVLAAVLVLWSQRAPQQRGSDDSSAADHVVPQESHVGEGGRVTDGS